MYRLTIDSETTGLPGFIDSNFPDPKEFKNYQNARIVQLSWICTYGNKIIVRRDFIVKVDDIQIKNSEIHKITNVICEEKGTQISDIFDTLSLDLGDVKMIIGYNLIFDLNVIKSELYRFNDKYRSLIDKLQQIETFDVMNSAIIHLKYPYRPKLINLYKKLFSEEYENVHNSLNDVLATFRCFLKIIYDVDLIIE